MRRSPSKASTAKRITRRSTAVTRAVVRISAPTGAAETVSMQARKGRASYLGARSVGHQDPGATSTALIFAALERTLRRSA